MIVSSWTIIFFKWLLSLEQNPKTALLKSAENCPQQKTPGRVGVVVAGRSFAVSALRLQPHSLADNLGNFLRTLATPEPINDWPLTTLKDKLIKLGGKVFVHAWSIAFQMAEVGIAKTVVEEILQMIAELLAPPVASTAWPVRSS